MVIGVIGSPSLYNNKSFSLKNAVAVNGCRAKYPLRSPAPRSWSRIRLFYYYPSEHYEFCQEVLSKTAPTLSPFTLDVGKLGAVQPAGHMELRSFTGKLLEQGSCWKSQTT
jgi:hypothetical protein